MGCLIRETGVWQMCKRDSGYLVLFLSLSFLLGVEIVVYHFLRLELPRDHYLTTLPLSLCIFSFALNHKSFNSQNPAARIGRKYSSYVYMYHPLVIKLFSFIPFLGTSILYVYTQPVVVFLATLSGIVIVENVHARIRPSKQKPGP